MSANILGPPPLTDGCTQTEHILVAVTTTRERACTFQSRYVESKRIGLDLHLHVIHVVWRRSTPQKRTSYRRHLWHFLSTATTYGTPQTTQSAERTLYHPNILGFLPFPPPIPRSIASGCACTSTRDRDNEPVIRVRGHSRSIVRIGHRFKLSRSC